MGIWSFQKRACGRYSAAMRAVWISFALGLMACGSVENGQAGDLCRALPLTCGPMGNASCCTSPYVPGGTFFRGYDTAAGTAFGQMTHAAMIRPFRLDAYEITVGRFRQFVNAKQGTQVAPPEPGAGARTLNGTADQGGWDASWNINLAANREALLGALRCDRFATWTDAPGLLENYPMLCITWYEAMAFCAWDGGFLPTEAESLFASSGGNQQRAYPWSSPPDSVVIDCSAANFGGDNWPQTACAGAGAQAVGTTSPSGDGAFGQADLGGNAFEWVLDWAKADTSSTCDDCAVLAPQTDRLIRGGSFIDGAVAARAAARSYSLPPDARVSYVGARCARAPAVPAAASSR